MITNRFGDKKTHIFTGSTHPSLAYNICQYLEVPLGKMEVGRFSDGEIRVEIDEPVRNSTVFIVQPTCADPNGNFSSNDSIMELCEMIYAVKLSSAKRIIVVAPYWGYARQDRRPGFERTPITSKLVAKFIQQAGATEIVFVDIHSSQQQGFFDIPTTPMSASPVLVADLWKRYDWSGNSGNVPVIVSPDVGGVVRARSFAKQ